MKIIHNAMVVYTNGVIERFDALKITDKGAETGKIIDGKFQSYGFIPMVNIKKIISGDRIFPEMK